MNTLTLIVFVGLGINAIGFLLLALMSKQNSFCRMLLVCLFIIFTLEIVAETADYLWLAHDFHSITQITRVCCVSLMTLFIFLHLPKGTCLVESELLCLQQFTLDTCAIMECLIHRAPVGMAFFNREGCTRKFNEYLSKKLNHCDGEGYIGQKASDLHRIGNHIGRHVDEVLETKMPILDDEIQIDEQIWIASYYPVFTPVKSVFLGVGVVITDVTAQKTAETQLRDNLKELVKADRQKNIFLAMLAHELRNPLSPILNSVYTLEVDLKDQPELTSSCQVIHRQVKNMSRILDDLLDVARLSRGKMTLHKEPVDINSIVRRCVEEQNEGMRTRHHTVATHLAEQQLIVNGDSTRLEQVFCNLLNNAIKYTEPGGKIDITSTVVPDWVIVTFRDNGIGISQDVLPHLFELFMQAERGLDRSVGGLGIGLHLSRDLVTLHGGTLEGHSAGLGCGSEFIVRLPLLQVGAETRAEGLVQKKLPNVSRKILVVDDNQDAALSLSLLLKKSGHDTQMIFDGAVVLRKVHVYHPDIILLDIGLPGIDGFTVCEMLREGNYTGYVIAVTGYGAVEHKERSAEAGFNAHLTKPVDPDKLQALIAELPYDLHQRT